MNEVVTVLLADEQPLFLDAVRQLLETQPEIRVVAAAENGVDTIAAAHREHPEIVMLSDRISNCGWVEVVERFAELTPRPRVLLLLPWENPARLIESLGMGVAGYIHKGGSFEELLRAIRCLADGDTYIPTKMVGPLIDRLLLSRHQAFAQWRQIEQLSRRERAVLALLAQGKNNVAIASSLVISPQTVKTHVQNIMHKLGVHSRVAAIAFAMRDGVMEELVEDVSVR
jgi:DNA-binding NarL/FixJ family response regulator